MRVSFVSASNDSERRLTRGRAPGLPRQIEDTEQEPVPQSLFLTNTSPPLCLVPARLEGAPIIRQILRVVIVSFAVSYCCSPVHCVRYRIVSVLANYLGLTRSASPPPTLTPEANSVGDKVQVGLPPAPVTAGGLL